MQIPRDFRGSWETSYWRPRPWSHVASLPAHSIGCTIWEGGQSRGEDRWRHSPWKGHLWRPALSDVRGSSSSELQNPPGDDFIPFLQSKGILRMTSTSKHLINISCVHIHTWSYVHKWLFPPSYGHLRKLYIFSDVLWHVGIFFF